MSDSLVTVVSKGIHKRTQKLPYTFLNARRNGGRAILKAWYRLLTELTVEGLEMIPREGPLLILPNHLSNLDGPLVLSMYPKALEMVGPADFRMEPFKSMMMAVYGMTLIRRGYTDRSAVSGIIRHLRNKKHLLMFPSGGMWEKRDMSVKSGALYFSQLTQTPILPVGISGAYLQYHRAMTMRRPRLTLRFGDVMEPISKEGSKKERELLLEDANVELQERIFDLLEPKEQERYRRWSRETYSLEVWFRSSTAEKRTKEAEGAPRGEVEQSSFGEAKRRRPEIVHSRAEGYLTNLAEFTVKPNLFRPMWLHARKNMDPFLKNSFYPPAQVRKSLEDLRENLTGEFSRYLPYRIGEEAHERTLEEITELERLCSEAEQQGKELQIVPTAYDPNSGTYRDAPVVI